MRIKENPANSTHFSFLFAIDQTSGLTAMVQCVIKFDNNPQGIYYSGQTLSGLVELENEKARNIRGLSLRIEGFAKVKTFLVWCRLQSQHFHLFYSASGKNPRELENLDER